tara:strand:- start:1438 stop:1962 length:525 start_codon:yes stop_codon:yes gene_type:complete
MKKFFSFSDTISGKTFVLRTLFNIVLAFPILIALISKWTTYFTSLGGFDLSDPSIENQMEIQSFGDELALKMSENPEFYLNDFMNSFTFGWIFIIFLCAIPPIWFGLATYYKRVSALFYDQRKGVFASLVLFDVVSDYIVLTSSGIINTIVSSFGVIIFAFLVFYNSKFENHEG